MPYTQADIEAAVLGVVHDLIRAPHGVVTAGQDRVDAVWGAMSEAERGEVLSAYSAVLAPVLGDLGRTAPGPSGSYGTRQIRDAVERRMGFEVVYGQRGEMLTRPEGGPMTWDDMAYLTRVFALRRRIEMVRAALRHMPGR